MYFAHGPLVSVQHTIPCYAKPSRPQYATACSGQQPLAKADSIPCLTKDMYAMQMMFSSCFAFNQSPMIMLSKQHPQHRN